MFRLLAKRYIEIRMSIISLEFLIIYRIIFTQMLQSFFRRQNQAELLLKGDVKVLDDKVRMDSKLHC